MSAAYVLDWLNLIARWAHLIAGISWIGASFYFVWLDDSLTPARDPDDVRHGVFGDLWAVHGGGFYHNQKYLTGPHGEPLTENLHWFKWEAYSTWITGMAMLALVYWAGASTFLIDRGVLALTPAAAITISIASLVIGWFVYDGLCRMLAARPIVLWTAVAAFLLFMDWALFHVFGGRAAFVHVGAIVGTIMVANVFFIIIPGQKKMLAQIRAGRTPDPAPGRLGKMRSVHNTYLTLPVLFTMISNHYPITYANANGWIVLAVIGAAGVLVRRFFVLSHKHRYAVGLPVAAAVLLAAGAIVARPHAPSAASTPSDVKAAHGAGAADGGHAAAGRAGTAGAGASDAGRARSGTAVTYAEVGTIVARRCAVCHAVKPTQPGFAAAPAGVCLDTPADVQANARRVYDQAVASHAMPLGNVTNMTDAERAKLGAWVDAGANILR